MEEGRSSKEIDGVSELSSTRTVVRRVFLPFYLLHCNSSIYTLLYSYSTVRYGSFGSLSLKGCDPEFVLEEATPES